MADSVMADGISSCGFVSGLLRDWADTSPGLGSLSLLPYRGHH